MTPRDPYRHRLQDLVDRFGGTCGGDLERRVTGFAPLDAASVEQLAFVSDARYRSSIERSLASAVLVTEADAGALPQQRDRLWVCKDPYLFFARIAQHFASADRPRTAPSRHPSAVIDATAQVDPTATIGPHAVIGRSAFVGTGSIVSAGCVVGDHGRIGADTLLHAGVSVHHGCIVGDRCIVHSGAVIGADGFGFAKDGPHWIKIPQVGNVRIGDDVEIGANTTIDRGTLDDTVIGNGVKLDNQIQIGHNVHVGDDTIMAAFVGVAGSAVIGRRCMIGGAARIMGHVTIADDVVVSTQTFVSRSIARRGQYTGYYPMAEHAAFEKNAAVLRRLDRLRDRVRGLEASSASSSRSTDVERSPETNAAPGDAESRLGTGASTVDEAPDPSDPERPA